MEGHFFFYFLNDYFYIKLFHIVVDFSRGKSYFWVTYKQFKFLSLSLKCKLRAIKLVHTLEQKLSHVKLFTHKKMFFFFKIYRWTRVF